MRGIYLGLASVGLVFIGQRIMFNAEGVTGGFTGRDAAPFNLFGFNFTNADPAIEVLGVPFEQLERLWYLGLVLVLFSWWFARNLVRSRPGRAMQQVRDSEVAAAVMGVNVPLYKAAAFTISSMYAGLGGVLYALAYQRIVPESFGFLFSIDFLVMIVIGGIGSIGGAIAGAVLITALPQILDHYAESLPLVVAPGADGLQSAEAARFIYGAAVVLILIFAPRGLAGIAARFRGRAPEVPGSSPNQGEHRMSLPNRSISSWAVCCLVLAALVGAGCGGKGDEGGGGGGGGGSVKTGPGVTDSEISLGLLTDLSGVFAPLGDPAVKATQLYWEQVNADGGVCDRDVKLIVKDHGYDPQKAVVQYRDLAPDVVALQQLLGSPITAALLPTLEQDSMTSILVAWPSSLLQKDFIIEIGPAVRRRDDQRPLLPDGRGQDQGGRQGRPHLLRG